MTTTAQEAVAEFVKTGVTAVGGTMIRVAPHDRGDQYVLQLTTGDEEVSSGPMMREGIVQMGRSLIGRPSYVPAFIRSLKAKALLPGILSKI